MDLQLMNKKALVTGSSEGIGKEIARVFIEQGCQVALNGRDKKNLAKTSKELGVNVVCPGDVSIPNQANTCKMR